MTTLPAAPIIAFQVPSPIPSLPIYDERKGEGKACPPRRRKLRKRRRRRKVKMRSKGEEMSTPMKEPEERAPATQSLLEKPQPYRAHHRDHHRHNHSPAHNKDPSYNHHPQPITYPSYHMTRRLPNLTSTRDSMPS